MTQESVCSMCEHDFLSNIVQVLVATQESVCSMCGRDVFKQYCPGVGSDTGECMQYVWA